MAMTINSEAKTIIATTFELPMVNNYLKHVVPVSDRQNWHVHITNESPVEYRTKKK